jgi:hypothetical protein
MWVLRLHAANESADISSASACMCGIFALGLLQPPGPWGSLTTMGSRDRKSYSRSPWSTSSTKACPTSYCQAAWLYPFTDMGRYDMEEIATAPWPEGLYPTRSDIAPPAWWLHWPDDYGINRGYDLPLATCAYYAAIFCVFSLSLPSGAETFCMVNCGMWDANGR